MERNNKICVFGYNFKHAKTQTGIINLILSGFKPDYVILQDWKKLNVISPSIRITPKDLFLTEPIQILKKFDIPYIVCNHNSDEAAEFLLKQNFELGIILGARILSSKIINKFNKGVLNMHPGLLPENRGLNTLKWAILRNIKQGVTSHIIDEKIDRGLLISKNKIDIYEDDTLLDVQIRIDNLEQKMMIDAVEKILNQNFECTRLLEEGSYNTPMTQEEEIEAMNKFLEYKKQFIGRN
jgi:folate-dependent phosphoribosylglycinamide formyltransferase PurN